MDTVAVSEFPLHVCRHPLMVGPRGATLKRISAETVVRVTVPSERDAAAAQQQQQGWSSSSLLDKNLVIQVRNYLRLWTNCCAPTQDYVFVCLMILQSI